MGIRCANNHAFIIGGEGMKGFSFWEEYEGTSEGSGRSEKIWIQNPDTGQTGLFKFKKDAGTTDHMVERTAQMRFL